MSRFSDTKEVSETTNYMGEKAYKRDAKTELVNAVLTSFIEDTYYEKSDKRIERISELVKEVAKKDAEFVAKLAIFARDTFNMRSSSHVLIGELAKVHKGDDLVARAIQKVALRPDDLIEIVAYSKKPIPNQVKKGVAKALLKFDAYQLAKYKAETRDMSLVDIVNLTHPPHTDVLAKLINGELKNTETWEARISAAGGDKEKVAAIWRDLLSTAKLGYMAALRNLRNIAATGDAEAITAAADFISNPIAVRNSRQFPFRFLSAYEALAPKSSTNSTLAFEKGTKTQTDKLIKAVTKALEISVENLPLLSGTTAILSDNSGSMRGSYGRSSALSANSNRTTSDIANLFALLYWLRADNTYVGLFGDNLIQPKLDRKQDIFKNFDELDKVASTVGGGTEQGIYDFFETALKDKVKVDRVVIFSDMQIGKNSWYGHRAGTQRTFNQLFKKYKEFNPDTKVYSVDLKGYGTAVFSDGIMEFSGFSDKLFRIMELAEQDKNALLTEVNKVQL